MLPLRSRSIKTPPGVRCLPMGELGALIRDVPLQEFGEEALQERMKDSKWLEEQIWNHARVLEAAMKIRHRHSHEVPHDF